MGGCSATLTSSSVVDGRPDRPSRGRWRIVPDVCRECSLKSIHCSKVHDSYLSRTPRPDKFTRPSVRTRRGNHPAPSGRPPRGGAKVTWFRYSCEYRRYSRDDPGDLTNGRMVERVRRRAELASAPFVRKTRIFASEGTKQGRNNHCTKVLGLGGRRPGVHGGAQREGGGSAPAEPGVSAPRDETGVRQECDRSATGVRKECAKPELRGAPGVRPGVRQVSARCAPGVRQRAI